MDARVKRAAWTVAGVAAFSAASFLAFRGYLTADMMVYFLSFKWCF